MRRSARAILVLVVPLLMAAGAVSAQQVSPRDQALFDAIHSKDIGKVQAALKQGANVNAIDAQGIPALLVAYVVGKTDILKLLLEKHADAKVDWMNQGTVLNLAANDDNMEIVPVLLENHVDVNLSVGYPGVPLASAATSGNLDICELLLEHHADIEASNPYGITALLATAQPPVGHDARSLDGMRWLLAHHANIEARDKQGSTPLMVAVRQSYYGYLKEDYSTTDQIVERVKLLLANHANLEARDNDGKTALILSAQHNPPEVVKALLAAHADTTAREKDGKTAMDVAADNMRCDNVLALEQGARSRTIACLRTAAAEFEKPDPGSSYDGKGKPDRVELFQIAVNTRLAMTPLPTEVPQEARAAYVQGNTMFKASHSDDDAKKAIGMYQEAVILAPWFVGAWNNMSLVQEKIGDYKGAAESLGYLVRVEPNGAHDQATLDHMYALQAKAKMAAQ